MVIIIVVAATVVVVMSVVALAALMPFDLSAFLLLMAAQFS